MFVGNDVMVAVGVGCLHDGLEVLLHEADLVSHALPGDGHAVLPELHAAAARRCQYCRSTSRAGWVLTTWATAAQ